MSDSPALHSRWLLLLKIEISSIVHYCFSTSQNEAQILTVATWQGVSNLTYIPVFFCEIFLSVDLYRLCKLGIV